MDTDADVYEAPNTLSSVIISVLMSSVLLQMNDKKSFNNSEH